MQYLKKIHTLGRYWVECISSGYGNLYISTFFIRISRFILSNNKMRDLAVISR